MKNIAVIAAHPDDEALGCGGTIFRHIAAGDAVHLMYMTDGISARTDSKAQKKKRAGGVKSALNLIRPKKTKILALPDNKMDTVPLLDIVKQIEAFLEQSKAEIVYTHYREDLNIDHCVTARAALTACRPLPGAMVKKILSFEVPSSTEWTSPARGFTPNFFVDISAQFKKKMALLECYEDELRPFPHARSCEAIEALAKWRGATIGKAYGEAFIIEREIA